MPMPRFMERYQQPDERGEVVFAGVPITNMSADELRAVVRYMSEEAQQLRDVAHRRGAFAAEMMGAAARRMR